MEIDVYQRSASGYVVYPASVEVIYPAMGLANEVGEFLGKIKKILRGDGYSVAQVDNMVAADFFRNLTAEQRQAIAGELGDVLWYIAAVATDLQMDLGEIAQANLDKLYDRSYRGVIKGNGDNR